MSILGRRVSKTVVALGALLMVSAALLTALSQQPAREIRLVSRGMAFYLENDLRTPNPTLHLNAGERVRLVVRNDERGMTHDLAVPAAATATGLLDWNEVGEISFNVPTTPGTYEYVCRPHLLMMRGVIRVY
jgi:plastocyanin